MSDPRYRTRRWRNLRAHVIRRDGRVCSVPHCTSDMAAPKMTHVDHIIEIKDGGDFWDPANCRVVCKIHHASKTLAVMAGRTSEPRSPNA